MYEDTHLYAQKHFVILVIFYLDALNALMDALMDALKYGLNQKILKMEMEVN